MQVHAHAHRANTLFLKEKSVNNKSLDLKLKSNPTEILIHLNYKLSLTLEHKVLLTFSGKSSSNTIHRIIVERSQDGVAFYSLQMFGFQYIKSTNFYIDETSDMFEKIWYRFRIKNLDGSEILSKALVVTL